MPKISVFVINADDAKVVAIDGVTAFCVRRMTGSNTSKMARFALGNPRSIR
jgi:hypothetical protein